MSVEKKEATRQSVAMTTLGCKVNQFESAAFASELKTRSVELVPFSSRADVYIINTCAVTAKAAAQSRQAIRRACRTNPDARVVVTGCYAQVAAQDVLELVEQPVCIVGNGFKHRLVEVALAPGSCDLEMYMGDIRRQREICPLEVDRFPGRTRAYLKVQDGCNQFCSYCIVPYARGRSRSLAEDKVLDQAERFAAAAYREVVLTGIHLGHYGLDFEPKGSLVRLLGKLLDRKLPVRYRLSSLEPAEVSEELLQMMQEHRQLMPYLHIPLQSGDARVLKRMNRSYGADDFARVIRSCVAHVPDMAIGVDVLVGFPGEDDAAFQNTYDLLTSLPVSYLHVFPYSKRPGTATAGMSGHLAGPVKKERVALLRELDHKKRELFYRQHVGTVRPVLVEKIVKASGMMRGFTDNYIPVLFKAQEGLNNRIIMVKLKSVTDEGVLGTLAGK